MHTRVFSIAAFDIGKKNTGFVRLSVDVRDPTNPVFNEINTALISVVGDNFTEMIKSLHASLILCPPSNVVLCEQQPVHIRQVQISSLLAAFSAQILYHFANIPPTAEHVSFVPASGKDKITIDPTNEVTIVGGSPSQKYNSRKKHSVHNLKVFLARHNLVIPQYKKLDDVADAFMHIYAWLIRNKYILQ